MSSKERVRPPVSGIFGEICTEKRGVDPATLKQVLTLATEIAREELWLLDRYRWGFLGPNAEERTMWGTTVFQRRGE